MGFVYYGNYAQYFEVARVEALRNLGVRYKDLEQRGIWLPVATYSVKFLSPAVYDDELLIRTTVKEQPGVRIRFAYECLNSAMKLVCTAQTDLVFMDASSRKPMRCPSDVAEVFAPYFS